MDNQNMIYDVLDRFTQDNVSLHRTEYYTELSFSINGEEILYPFKVDSGSPITIIGSELVDNIFPVYEKSITDIHAVSVSGQDLNALGFVVEDFKIGNKIILPKVEIFLSDRIGKKALLGLDILSLFNISYVKREKTIHISIENGYIKELMEHMKAIGKDYLSYEFVADIEIDSLF